MNDIENRPEVTVTSGPGEREGVQIIKVSGPLTIRNFFDFQAKSRETDARVLIVDLSEVSYIDSAALGSLVGIHVSYDKTGRKYALAGVNSRIRTVLEVSHVDQFLVLFPTTAAAEAALA